jgi:hypothetical protein
MIKIDNAKLQIETTTLVDEAALAHETTAQIDQSLLSSKPRVLVAAYDVLNNQFYLKWLLDSFGNSNLVELNVNFLEYNSSGIIQKFSKSKKIQF